MYFMGHMSNITKDTAIINRINGIENYSIEDLEQLARNMTDQKLRVSLLRYLMTHVSPVFCKGVYIELLESCDNRGQCSSLIQLLRQKGKLFYKDEYNAIARKKPKAPKRTNNSFSKRSPNEITSSNNEVKIITNSNNPDSNKTEKLASDNTSFNEGNRTYKTHMTIERDHKLIREAKRIFLLNHNSQLFCEVCGFNFSDNYGSRGLNFIEGHHKIPISKLNPNDKTHICDIAMLCSNCHRMIHRGPLLTVDELRKLVQSNKK